MRSPSVFFVVSILVVVSSVMSAPAPAPAPARRDVQRNEIYASPVTFPLQRDTPEENQSPAHEEGEPHTPRGLSSPMARRGKSGHGSTSNPPENPQVPASGARTTGVGLPPLPAATGRVWRVMNSDYRKDPQIDQALAKNAAKMDAISKWKQNLPPHLKHGPGSDSDKSSEEGPWKGADP